jgi:hypothetical protein
LKSVFALFEELPEVIRIRGTRNAAGHANDSDLLARISLDFG